MAREETHSLASHGTPQLTALVLCGGAGRRMGGPKAELEFGGEPLVLRMLRLLEPLASPVAIAAAPNQTLPELPTRVLVSRDAEPEHGPLEGIRAGFAVLSQRLPPETFVYVTGCDTPLLHAGWVRRLAFLAAGYEACIPCDGPFPHPLSGCYRLSALTAAEELLAAGRYRTAGLQERLRTRRVPIAELRCVDPQLDTLLNVNTPESLAEAIRRWESLAKSTR